MSWTFADSRHRLVVLLPGLRNYVSGGQESGSNFSTGVRGLAFAERSERHTLSRISRCRISSANMDVRQEPQVRPGAIPPSATLSAEPATQEQESKGPPVSKAHLQAWFDFYKKIGGDLREDIAHASARMNFQGKTISRARIRALLGPRPMGRPKTRPT